MKVILRVSACLLVTLQAGNLSAATVVGLIFATDRQPISHAQVTWRHTGLAKSVTVYSDAEGRYRVDLTDDGDYSLRVRLPRDESEWHKLFDMMGEYGAVMDRALYDEAPGVLNRAYDFSQLDLDSFPDDPTARYDSVWLCGTNSDSIIHFQPADETFKVYQLPTRVSFTRELEVDEDGNVWTSTSNMPFYQVEGMRGKIVRLSFPGRGGPGAHAE